MQDAELLHKIHELVEEEHTLERAHVGTGLSAQERDRLHELEVQLDQCWDLLAQRRARRKAGLDPDVAAPRGAEVVEHFLQ